MSDLSQLSQTAPETAPEVVDSTESGEELSSESSAKGENDPNESFSDWLKRQGDKKETSKTDSKAAKDPKVDSKLPPAPDMSKEVAKALEGDKTDAAKLEAELKTTENDNIRVLKVGDKKFKAEDVAKLDKDYTETSTKLKVQLEENQKMIADVEQFVKTLREKPGEILDRFKITQEQIEQHLWDKYYKFKNETPQQKADRLEKELTDIRTKEETSRTDAQNRQQQEANNRFWQGKIKEGLDSNTLPENEWTIQRMVGYIKQMQQKGLNLTTAELGKYVKADYENYQLSVIKSMSPEQAAKVLGKDTLDKIRAQDVEKLKQDKFKNTNPSKGAVKKDETKKKVYKSPYDMLDDL